MKILILGGSKFMGLKLIEKLISLGEHTIYIINRGNVYWDGLFYDIIKDQKMVKHFKADRNNKNEFKQVLQEISTDVQKDGQLIDYIVDFSAFNKRQVRKLLKNFYESFKNYIYVSTDSTYNSSPLALERNNEFFVNNKNVELVKEEMSIWSDDKEIRKKLKKHDEYGYNKFKCEIEIENFFKTFKLIEQGKNYIFLRFPDVIGSYDESYRTWIYIEWIKNSNLLPIEYEKVDTLRKLSFVNKSDVVDLCIKIMSDEIKDKSFWNQAYNIGSEENLTLVEIVDYISKKINWGQYKYEVVDYCAKTYYPSVTIAAVDISKAKKILNFEPTSVYQGLDEEIEFFVWADKHKFDKFSKEYKETVEELPKVIRNHIKETNATYFKNI
jgi:nucleoside-diphosphate-sugar epimerase